MTTAISAQEWRGSALAENKRLGREAAIKAELLKDTEGLQSALEGCLYFLEGGEGYRVEGLDEVRLSPGAARFLGIA